MITGRQHSNLVAGHWCPIIHWLNPKSRVNVKNDQLKAIKATLGLSRRHVYALMFEVSFYFLSLTTTKPIIKEAPIYLCLAIRFIVQLLFLLGYLVILSGMRFLFDVFFKDLDFHDCRRIEYN